MEERGPIFVVGAARSGTTLLRRILNTHPDVFLAKETHFLLRAPAVNSLGTGVLAPADRPGLVRIATRYLRREQWTGIDRIPGLVERARSTEHFYAAICHLEAPDRPLAYWGDNTPNYVRIVWLLLSVFPGARAIHMVRDPRAVAASIMALRFGANTAGMAAIEWTDAVALGMSAEALFPGRVIHIRFEDLLAAPSGATARLASWLGLDDRFDPDRVDPEMKKFAGRLEHHGNIGRPIDPRVADRWRGLLGPRQQVDVERWTWELATALGYEMPRYAFENDREKYARVAAGALEHTARHVGRRLWDLARGGAREEK